MKNNRLTYNTGIMTSKRIAVNNDLRVHISYDANKSDNTPTLVKKPLNIDIIV